MADIIFLSHLKHVMSGLHVRGLKDNLLEVISLLSLMNCIRISTTSI